MEQTLRQELVECGKKLVETGLVQGTWGNISVRLDDKYMLCTPSGLDYMRLTTDDMVKVSIDTLKFEGKQSPTSEKGLHAAIYKARADIKAIVHTHSKFCCVFAAAVKDMPVLPDYKDIFKDEVKVAAYALPGTEALSKNTVTALGDNLGVIMANHGMAACGENLEKAFENCEKLEENAKRYILTR